VRNTRKGFQKFVNDRWQSTPARVEYSRTLSVQRFTLVPKREMGTQGRHLFGTIATA
jgi:hypothetical protein